MDYKVEVNPIPVNSNKSNVSTPAPLMEAIKGIQIKIDGQLEIAVCKNRHTANWKNKQILWSDLVKKLSTTHRTAETYAEYISSDKPRQAEIKDIGGFVGGYLTGGKRKTNAVLHRQILTLDLDYAPKSFWADFAMLYGNAAALYSTHKHCAEKPRLRLIIPLDKPVSSSEYEAIARRVAGNCGINYFDKTTFQPTRLMYWPSTSKDGEYLFEHQDGEWLNTHTVLASYRDWKDMSEWPVTDAENVIPCNEAKAAKKQENPLLKRNSVGIFCRAFTIPQAIETFLPEIYEPCDIENRYTYKGGSTAAGLILYEDNLFAYSHHGTDPASGKLCNAFDLVRIHLYGHLDKNLAEPVKPEDRPSDQAMIAMLNEHPVYIKQRAEEAADDFEELQEEQPGNETADNWRQKLEYDKKGKLKATVNNIALILGNDPKLKGAFLCDAFSKRYLIIKKTPWRVQTELPALFSDADESEIIKYLEKFYKIKNRPDTKDALNSHFRANSFHPVREYLNSLKWDGKNRIKNILIDYLGAADSEYVKAVTQKALIAAVARVYQPGIKFDHMLTLVGDQGQGKSTLLAKLGKEWFSDGFHFGMLHKKDSIEQIQGSWLIEIGELGGMKKADVDAIKHFLTTCVDRCRPAYGKHVVEYPRQCIFFGTTNRRDFLRDHSGNRRFWPVPTMDENPVKNVFKDLTELEVNQIWAEAVALYKAGESLHLDADLEAQAWAVQDEHTEQDDRTGLIKKFLDTPVPENWENVELNERRIYFESDPAIEGKLRNRICVAEIWCELFGYSQKDMTSINTKAIHTIMRSFKDWGEYKSRTVFKIYGNQRGYFRKDQILPQAEKNTTGTTGKD